MRLIDADALFNWNGKKLSDAVKYGNKDEKQQSFSYSTIMMYEVADEIDDAPTVDAVTVVRCEQCRSLEMNAKLLDKNDKGDNDYWCHELDRIVSTIGFCGHGVKIESGDTDAR